MKKLYISIFLILTIKTFSQFSIKTELKYMQLINKQGNTELIEDNLQNAELATDSLIEFGENKLLYAQFFNSLSESYFLTKNYELSLFSLLRQRCLFPNKSIEQKHKVLFLETAYRCNLNDSLSEYLLKESSISKLEKEYTNKLELLLKLSTRIKKKKLNPYIYKIGLQLRQKENKIPIWYQHWEFLTLINLKEDKKDIAIKRAKGNEEIYKQIKDKKLKYKIYRRAIKHYIKTNSFLHASKLLKDYNSENLPIILHFDIYIKKLRVFLKV